MRRWPGSLAGGEPSFNMTADSDLLPLYCAELSGPSIATVSNRFHIRGLGGTSKARVEIALFKIRGPNMV
jgi:hypothetical protein